MQLLACRYHRARRCQRGLSAQSPGEPGMRSTRHLYAQPVPAPKVVSRWGHFHSHPDKPAGGGQLHPPYPVTDVDRKPGWVHVAETVSYTHLTLPTKRIV